ncbi:MAG TPA: hypothetical protein VGQ17_08135 [Gemmatimonadales bacterium]|jgi:hypothetical protein|nr:hypothetical protein [Gemmatimonadales bacterium]
MAGLLAAASAAMPLAAQTPAVTVSGVGYAQYQYLLKDTANHVNNFDVTRAYINVLGSFAYGIKTRVTADIYRNADGSLAYRLKYAYASWTPEQSALTFKMGQIHTPWLDWEEHLWDYRMQGQMVLERGGYISSSDFGAGVDGMWKFDLVNMEVGVYNGENYNRAPGDQRKDLMGRVSVRVLGTDQGGRDGGLRLTGYGQYGKPTGGGSRQRYIGALSYRSKMLTLAGEYTATKDSSTTAPTAEAKGRVISGFGVLRIPPTYKFQIIARVDVTDPNTLSTSTSDRQTRYIGGLAFQPSGNLRVLADLDHLVYQGGSPTPAAEAARSQALFQIQLTF